MQDRSANATIGQKMLYKKRPLTVQAIQVNNTNKAEVEKFIGANGRSVTNMDGSVFVLFTNEGVMRVYNDHWILKGIEGEIYSCTPSVFQKTYDKVQDDQFELPVQEKCNQCNGTGYIETAQGKLL
jgi:hypothetical protein